VQTFEEFPRDAIHESGASGLGNLADELGESWDEEDGVEEEDIGDAGVEEQEATVGEHVSPEGTRDSGVALESGASRNISLSPNTARKHKRNHSIYDGSDYGDDSDLETNQGITLGLEKQMAAIESLARRGMEVNGSASDEVVSRVTERLKDLGSQSGIESGATRCVHWQSSTSNIY
jgi:hypothetical protein